MHRQTPLTITIISLIVLIITGCATNESKPISNLFQINKLRTPPSPMLVTEVRKALVIGNKHYPDAGGFSTLTNPINDATAMQARLQTYGFIVTLVMDADRYQMEDAIEYFTNSLEPGDVALVYYSGHGTAAACSNERNKKQNYLIPVGHVINNSRDLCKYGISVQLLLDNLSKRNTSTNILLLDACRDAMPSDNNTVENTDRFSSEYDVVETANYATQDDTVETENDDTPEYDTVETENDNTREYDTIEHENIYTNGFVEMRGLRAFIGYAAEPGRPSMGSKKKNEYSWYTASLLNMLRPPYENLPLELLFKGVQDGVKKIAQENGKTQVPWASIEGLEGNFCFRTPCVSIAEMQQQSANGPIYTLPTLPRFVPPKWLKPWFPRSRL